jgi:hypothetical protein
MHKRGCFTDEEIEEDYKQLCKDLDIFYEELDKHYKPFGSSVKKNEIPEEVPW